MKTGLATPSATLAAPVVAIVGGGIGGLALGVAPGQRGIGAVVCERAPELREIGAGLPLTPNAT